MLDVSAVHEVKSTVSQVGFSATAAADDLSDMLSVRSMYPFERTAR